LSLPPFRPRNIGNVRVNGVELFSDLRLIRGLSTRTTYTFLESETSTESLLRRPRHRGNVQLNFQQDSFHFNLNTSVVGKRDDIGVRTGATVKEAGHVKLDLASSYVLPWQLPGAKDLSLFGKIENLLDKRYEEADGFRARPLNFLIGIRAVFGSK
jgi:vitamin B12 transporter